MPRIDQQLGFTRYEADEYYKQALDAYRKGDYDTAVDAMKNAIAALPKKAEYYAARGLMYLEDGVTQSALEDFDRRSSCSRTSCWRITGEASRLQGAELG